MKKYAIIDIDGCLNYYPECFLEWLLLEKNIHFNTYEEFKSFYGSDYKLLKNEYRNSGIKKTLKVRNDSSSFLNHLRSLNYTIFIVTSRHNIGNVYTDTEYWLIQNNLIYDNLFFINKKGSLILFDTSSQILVVDDDLEGLIPYKKYNNSKLFYFTEKDSSIEGITNVNTWNKIKPYV